MNRAEAKERLFAGEMITHPKIAPDFFQNVKGKFYDSNISEIPEYKFKDCFGEGWSGREGFSEGWEIVKLNGWDDIANKSAIHFKLEDRMGSIVGYTPSMLMNYLKETYQVPDIRK